MFVTASGVWQMFETPADEWMDGLVSYVDDPSLPLRREACLCLGCRLQGVGKYGQMPRPPTSLVP